MKQSTSLVVLASILFFSSCGQPTRSRTLIVDPNEEKKASALTESSTKEDIVCSKSKAVKAAYDSLKMSIAAFAPILKEEVENIYATNTFESFNWSEKKNNNEVISKLANFIFLVEYRSSKIFKSIEVDLLTCEVTTSGQSISAKKVDVTGKEIE